MKRTLRHSLTFVAFSAALCAGLRPQPAPPSPVAADADRTRNDIVADNLCQHWVHSREEQRPDDPEQTFRPAGSRSFPPTRFRMEYKFAHNGNCEWLYLAPDDDHRFKSGKWMLDATDKTILRITTDGTTTSYAIRTLAKDLLRLAPIEQGKEE